jgi:hypothetical protein
VKGSRFITHMKKLRDVETALANFFASGVLRLGDKLGPILWQFPERLPTDPSASPPSWISCPAPTPPRPSWPRATTSGWTAALDRGRRCRRADPPRLRDPPPGLPGPEFVALLREHAGLVFADTAGRWPYAEDVTADFVYVRLHGAEQLYASGYTDPQLDWWAARIREWRRGCQPADAACVLGGPLARPPPPAATSTSTSTTTPRCTRPSTRSGCGNDSKEVREYEVREYVWVRGCVGDQGSRARRDFRR